MRPLLRCSFLLRFGPGGVQEGPVSGSSDRARLRGPALRNSGGDGKRLAAAGFGRLGRFESADQLLAAGAPDQLRPPSRSEPHLGPGGRGLGFPLAAGARSAIASPARRRTQTWTLRPDPKVPSATPPLVADIPLTQVSQVELSRVSGTPSTSAGRAKFKGPLRRKANRPSSDSTHG